MKKKARKFVSLLLSVMMVFSVLTPAAFAQETEKPLPVHLENPNNRFPMAMVTVVNPTARIVEMEQVFEEQNSPRLRTKQKEEIVPGYAEYKYKVKLQHDNGTVSEEVISVYVDLEMLG